MPELLKIASFVKKIIFAIMRKRILSFSCLCILAITSCSTPERQLVWNIGVADSSAVDLALRTGINWLEKVMINNCQEEKIQLVPGGSDASITGDMSQAKPVHLIIPVKREWMKIRDR